MPNPPDLSFAVRLPPEQAMAYFRSLGYALPENTPAMLAEAEALAFTVANAMSLDILKTIRQHIDQALAEGKTERWFQQTLTPILQEKGWWGRQKIVAPDGSERTVQLGSPWRLHTIYQTNLQTAYMAGRYRTQIAAAAHHPYLQYVAVMDSRTRPAHAAMDGRIFPIDDPIWNTHYPPNGWNCRCAVVALSEVDIQRDQLEVESSAGRLVEVEKAAGKDPETGDPILRTVTGLRITDRAGNELVFSPDPGFDYNPGKAWARFDTTGKKPAIAVAPGQKSWRDYQLEDIRAVSNERRLPTPPTLPEAPDKESAIKQVRQALDITDAAPWRIVETPIGPVVIRSEWLPHIVEERGQKRERYANYILPTLTKPFEVWLTAYEDGNYRKHYLGLFQDDRDLMVVVRENVDGSLMWNVIRMGDKQINRKRVGTILWPLLEENRMEKNAAGG